jgi:hypothetical protein
MLGFSFSGIFPPRLHLSASSLSPTRPGPRVSRPLRISRASARARWAPARWRTRRPLAGPAWPPPLHFPVAARSPPSHPIQTRPFYSPGPNPNAPASPSSSRCRFPFRSPAGRRIPSPSVSPHPMGERLLRAVLPARAPPVRVRAPGLRPRTGRRDVARSRAGRATARPGRVCGESRPWLALTRPRPPRAHLSTPDGCRLEWP